MIVISLLALSVYCQSQNSVKDSTDSYFNIGHSDVVSNLLSLTVSTATNCYIQKTKDGKQIWKVVYDSSGAYCQGYAIFNIEDTIYAIFKIQSPSTSAGSFNLNQTTNAPEAFKSGLWSTPGQGKNNIDVIVQIDSEDGLLTSATYLFSKYGTQAQVASSMSYTMSATQLTLQNNMIRVRCKSAAYPPGPSSDKANFVPYKQKEGLCVYVSFGRELDAINAVESYSC